MTLRDNNANEIWAWLGMPGTIMKELYKEFKGSADYTHLKNQIEVLFGKDQESIDFVLRDRPNWVSEDGRHYLKWLNDLSLADVQNWASLGTGRTKIH